MARKPLATNGYEIKHKTDGSRERYKVRLDTKGYVHHMHGGKQDNSNGDLPSVHIKVRIKLM